MTDNDIALAMEKSRGPYIRLIEETPEKYLTYGAKVPLDSMWIGHRDSEVTLIEIVEVIRLVTKDMRFCNDQELKLRIYSQLITILRSTSHELSNAHAYLIQELKKLNLSINLLERMVNGE